MDASNHNCCCDSVAGHIRQEEEAVNKTELIEVIEGTFPSDSADEKISATGKELLREAIDDSFDWRKLPKELLESYAEKCLEHRWGD